ncbi:MAG: hypothetical protein JNK04_20385 [Myxococcales bacterium]|nr:hypothetical protein [Myxococcales bacterium]
MSAPENPFERFDIDPTAGVEAITEHMRELVAEVPEAERQLVRDSWETLTLQPQRRIAAALATFIDREPAPVIVPRPAPRTPTGGGPHPAPLAPQHALHLELAPAGDLGSPSPDPLLESLRT